MPAMVFRTPCRFSSAMRFGASLQGRSMQTQTSQRLIPLRPHLVSLSGAAPPKSVRWIGSDSRSDGSACRAPVPLKALVADRHVAQDSGPSGSMHPFGACRPLPHALGSDVEVGLARWAGVRAAFRWLAPTDPCDLPGLRHGDTDDARKMPVPEFPVVRYPRSSCSRGESTKLDVRFPLTLVGTKGRTRIRW